MFPVTIAIHNLGQLNAVLSALGLVEAPKEAAAPAGKSSAKAADSKPGAEAAKTPAADALAKKDADSAKALGVEGEPATHTYEDVKQAILNVSKQKGRDAALKLLGEFGVEKGPDLQKTPEKFAPFLARAKALLS